MNLRVWKMHHLCLYMYCCVNLHDVVLKGHHFVYFLFSDDWNSAFWDMMPCSLLKVNQWERYHLHLQGQRIREARRQHGAGSKQISSTLLDFQQTTEHYIPDGRILHNHFYENLDSYTMVRGVIGGSSHGRFSNYLESDEIWTGCIQIATTPELNLWDSSFSQHLLWKRYVELHINPVCNDIHHKQDSQLAKYTPHQK
jgi:hypothetical protein